MVKVDPRSQGCWWSNSLVPDFITDPKERGIPRAGHGLRKGKHPTDIES